MKDIDKKIRAYALKNGIAHEGKPRTESVLSALFNEGLKRDKVKEVIPKIKKIISEVEKLSIDEQKREFEQFSEITSERKSRIGLPELPNVKGKVIMRFAPSPSGPLHIGHAMTACISFLYVNLYGGKFYIRIEDTNPENIYKPAYKMIEDDSEWLFDNKAEIITQSERMNLYYNYVEKLIKNKSVYVCTCSSETFKEFVDSKKNCPCRNSSVDDNLEKWKKMLDKSGFKEGEAVLRFKSDMKHKNPAMRDFPLARINLESHPLQKKKYRVWPLMNLAVAVDDIEMKMTHIIRAKDHRDNATRQEMIYKALGKEKQIPWTSFLGRYKFKEMELSATKMRQAIEAGKFKGWDDKRLPTLISLKKQGYKPSAFWKFAEQVGLSESDKVMSKAEYFTLLDSFNK